MSYPARTPAPHSGPTDLRAYVAVLRRRKWTVILVSALTIGAAVFFSVRQTPVYDSSARVLVKPLNPNQILQGFSYAISMDTEAALVSSPDVAVLAADAARAKGWTEPEPGAVGTSVPLNTNFLDITYTSPDPDASALWAQSYAEGYIADREEQAKNLYTSASQGYQDQLTSRQGDLAKAEAALAETKIPGEKTKLENEISNLQEQIRFLQLQLAQVPIPAVDSAQMISEAAVPSSPSSPDYVRNILLAIMAGLALGVGVAFLREQLDDRMSGPDDMEEQIGAPAMAVVPHFSIPRKKADQVLVARDKPKSPPAESYRTVRTNVEFMARTNELKLIAVASPSLSEGKTTTAANLAVTLAQAGRRVVVVSCDLRKPRLHRVFGLTNDLGLSDVLADGTSAASAAQRVSGIPTLRVIASGTVPHNPAELLGSDQMMGLLIGLRENADFVILDTAPVLAVSDALILAPRCDGILMVVDASSTTRTAARVAREQVEQVGGNIVGGVFNNFDPNNAKTYPGAYRYYTGYGYGREEPKKGDTRPVTEVQSTELWS